MACAQAAVLGRGDEGPALGKEAGKVRVLVAELLSPTPMALPEDVTFPETWRATGSGPWQGEGSRERMKPDRGARSRHQVAGAGVWGGAGEGGGCEAAGGSWTGLGVCAPRVQVAPPAVSSARVPHWFCAPACDCNGSAGVPPETERQGLCPAEGFPAPLRACVLPESQHWPGPGDSRKEAQVESWAQPPQGPAGKVLTDGSQAARPAVGSGGSAQGPALWHYCHPSTPRNGSHSSQGTCGVQARRQGSGGRPLPSASGPA